MMLDIIITGKTGEKETYKNRLEAYIQNTEDPGLLNLARNMLSDLTGEKEGENIAQEKSIDLPDSIAGDNYQDLREDSLKISAPPTYSKNLGQTHIFVLAMEPQQSENSKDLTADLENFHKENFPNERLRTGNISFTRENTIVIISPFSNAEKALAYRTLFLNSFNNDSVSEELKLSSFVISIENFQELNKRKNIEEYRAFYLESYP